MKYLKHNNIFVRRIVFVTYNQMCNGQIITYKTIHIVLRMYFVLKISIATFSCQFLRMLSIRQR